jgi:hypothetical protein
MARFKPSALIAGIRGTVAGVTFSANGSSTYCRQWARPTLSRSNAQSLQRGLLGNFPQAWRALSSAQRAGWDTYAALAAQELTDPFGDAYYASGFNWYVRINTHRVRAGQSPSATAPAAGTPTQPTLSSVALYASGGSSSALVYPSGEFTSYYLVLFVAMNSSTGTANRTGRFYECLIDTSPGATGVTFQTELESVFGDIGTGQRFTVNVYRQSTEGRRSSPAVDAGDTT